MATSIVTLTIETSATILSGDDVVITYNNGANDFSLFERYRLLRTGANQVTITNDLNNFANANNLAQAINLDATLNGFDLFALVANNEVTITSNSYTCTSVSGNMVTNSKITSTITNGIIPPAKTLSITEYNTGSPSVCEDIDAVLTITGGTGLYNIYLDNVLNQSSQSSPVTVSLKRGVGSQIRVIDSANELIGTIVSKAPRKLITSDISNALVNLEVGANLTVSVPFISQYVSPYTYSLDGTDYQTSNIFTSLVDGDYTVYVKDALGCVTTKSLVIDGVTIVQETIMDISDINPLRYALYEPNAKKNFNNTLSNDSLRLKSYCYKQPYLITDDIKGQFKTNASYINVFALDADLNTTIITPLKKTENLGKSEKSTSTYYSRGDGKSAIYFGVVDLLDPITDAVIGDFNYGSQLPIWANKTGNYVIIEDIGQVKIDAIVYDETYKAFVLEFNIIYSGNPVTKKISANYNLQPYEVYEFSKAMNTLPTEFNIVIEVGKSINEIEYTYISEKVERVEDSKFLLNIDYWNNENVGGYNYQTGIKNKVRINGYFDYVGEQITEGYNGDTNYYVTKNEVYSTETITFYKIPFQIAHKLRLIFSHKNLFINGLGYKIADIPEIEGEKMYNLKKFSVTLKHNGNYFTENADEVILDNNLELSYDIESIKNKKLLLWSNNI